MWELKKWREQKWVRIGTDGKIKGPNSLIKAYLKDFKKRFKYPHDSKKYKKALEAGKVL